MKKLFILILFLSLLNIFQVSFSAADGYQPLSAIPGLTDTNVTFDSGGTNSSSGSGLSNYIGGLYKWGVALTSGLAVLVIMWGGVGYMTSAGGSGIEEAKGRISAALMGLLLALGSYIILQTINKDLLKTTFNLTPVTVTSTATTDTTATNTATSNTSTNISDLTEGVTSTGCTTSSTGSITCSTNKTVLSDGEVNQDAINAAMAAYGKYEGQVTNKNYIGIMDYSQGSSEPRFYIMNTQTGEITSTKAAHGSGSDPNNTGYATVFSNNEGSYQSSLGSFVATPYYSESMGKDALKWVGEWSQ
jgi:hypothetical protein